MTRILSIGYPVPSLVTGQPDVRAFPRGLGPGDLAALADDLGDEDVLVVQPAWDVEPDLLRLQTVRAVLALPRVAIHPTALSPLAGGALCALAAALGAAGLSAGALWAAMPDLERRVLTVARLDRVDRLLAARPPARTRLASLLPSTSFAVSSWPHTHARRLRPEDRGISLPPQQAWDDVPLRRLTLAAPRGAELQWVEEAVLPLLGAVDVVQVDRPPLSRVYWGSNAVLEAAAFPVDLAALRSVAERAARPALCPWCGAQVASVRCPFCGADRA